MKSKRAEEYIDESIYDAAELVDKDGCGMAVVRRSDAYRAVEIAEEEMIEKAVTAYISICDHNINEERCALGGECDAANCPYCKAFKQKMMEIQNK